MAATKSTSSRPRAPGRDGLSSFVEQLVNRVLTPLDLVLLSRELIQETMDEAAERGRMTRADANDLVGVLVARGRRQTDALLGDMEASAPIAGYDELTAAQAQKRLGDLKPADLRQLRDYERRHANRKTVLEGIERALA